MEIVRESFEAWNAGDMVAYRELYDHLVRGCPRVGLSPGLTSDATRSYANWSRYATPGTATPRKRSAISSTPPIVSSARFVLHGQGRGPEAKLEMTVVFTVRKGRILYLEASWDHAEVLETMGLSE